MFPFADLDKPPFFTAIYLTPEEGGNHGLHSEAVSTLVSGATLVPGFVGFTNDVAVAKRPIKVLYWRTFRAMQAWQRTVKDLLPNITPHDYTHNYKIDEGKSISYITDFNFEDGSSIRAYCDNWSNIVEKNERWVDSMSVEISTAEAVNWINNEAYN